MTIHLDTRGRNFKENILQKHDAVTSSDQSRGSIVVTASCFCKIFSLKFRPQDGKLPCLDLKVWTHGNEILHVFYKKPMSSPYTIMADPAISMSMKRNTILQEGLRRLRNHSTFIPWEVKAECLSKFSNTLRVSGYSSRFRYNILKGIIDRYLSMLDQTKQGNIRMYRSREEILTAKQSRGGNNAST